MNDIIQLLELEDENLIVSNVEVEGINKRITLETKPSLHFCPKCNYRMNSRGLKSRKINHPVLQETFSITIFLKQRRWRCSNKQCGYECNESFNFVKKYRRNTNATELLIVEEFRKLNSSATAIGNRFHVSDTYVLSVFDKYVRMSRLPLSDAICIDEVYIDMDPYCKYALVILDFHTGEPIDVLRSRRDNVTEPYFVSIPKEERYGVKYLISDMYNPYINYVAKYFPNAVSVVDSFHVIQWIIRSIDKYIRQLLKEFKQRDAQRAAALSEEKGYLVNLPMSDEVYMLQKYRWLILANQSSIKYHLDVRIDSHFRRFMNTYDYEKELFSIDKNLLPFRELKEKYVVFNDRYAGDPLAAAPELDKLIDLYSHCGYEIFREFGKILVKNKEYIINSFVMLEKINSNGSTYNSRLSNGPIESLNRKIKDLKRSGRGFKNFDHFRNRFLFATRGNPPLNGIEDESLVQYFEETDL